MPEVFQKTLLHVIKNDMSISESQFNDLALRAFHWQYRTNKAYRNFCDEVLRSGRQPKQWSEIPLLPVVAYKHQRISTFAPDETQQLFQSSGTTKGQLRGKHYFRDLNYYDAAIKTLFKKHVMKGDLKLPVLSLIPSHKALPDSSLSYMTSFVVKHFAKGSLWAIQDKELQHKKVFQWFQTYIKQKQPLLIMTTSFALADLLDVMHEKKLKVKLPKGSRMMLTGGFKGRRKEIAQDAFTKSITQGLGISPKGIISEYGMSELSSQIYNGKWASWMRVGITNPATGKLSSGRGLIRIIDLANQNSCCFIQTEDEGYVQNQKLILMGRAPGAELRGCSLTHEEMQRIGKS